MRKRVAAVGLWLLLCAAPAGAAADTVMPVARNQVATCVRDAGAGQLQLQAPLTKTTTPTDLLTASPEQIERSAGTDLGNLVTCPEAASGGGLTVVAGFVKVGDSIELRAAGRSNLDAFAEPVKLAGDTGSPEARPAVAVGPRGDAVVAWEEVRRRGEAGDDASVRMLAARRPAGPGARFGPAEEVVPWTAQRDFRYGTNDIAAGVDGAGRVTVASAIGVRPQARASRLSTLAVSTADPGQPLRKTTVAANRQDVGRLALAVAPDGAALLVTTYQEQVHVFEHSAGGAFTEGTPLGGEEQTADDAAVALDPAGGAVVAWSDTSNADDEGALVRTAIRASRRANGGEFGPPATIWSRVARDDGSFIAFTVEDKVSPPLDPAQLRTTIAADGSTAITWVAPRRVDGDILPAGFIATAAPQEAFAVARLGNPCRPVDNIVPFRAPGSRLTAAWTDNAAQRLDATIEFPLKSGRLHVEDPRAVRPAVASTAPAIALPRVNRLQRLWSQDAIEVPVDCGGPCDLRGFVPDGPQPAMAASTSLRARGRTIVRLYPVLSPIGLRPETLRVVVHGCSPDGTSRATATTTVRVVRNRPPKVPEPVDVRARRSGDRILVSWRTPFAARRTSFAVYGHTSRSDQGPPATETVGVDGRARTRFRARLVLRPGQRVRYVTVDAYSTEFTRQHRHVTVAVRR